ncbi:MAG: hypothetical protein DLM72_07955, partial [Candidatus Nitrosopolaris wilkensis]
HRNNGILAFLKTRSMVFANLTYLDSLNRYIVLWSYKALTGLSEKRLVSTKPSQPYIQHARFNKMASSGAKRTLMCVRFIFGLMPQIQSGPYSKIHTHLLFIVCDS